MPGKKEKVQKKSQPSVKATGSPSHGELSEKDLQKVAAGQGKEAKAGRADF